MVPGQETSIAFGGHLVFNYFLQAGGGGWSIAPLAPHDPLLTELSSLYFMFFDVLFKGPGSTTGLVYDIILKNSQVQTF